MTIDATCHAVMNLTTNHCWIGMRTNLKTSNAVIVHVIPFIITLKKKERYLDIPGKYIMIDYLHNCLAGYTQQLNLFTSF